MRKYAIVSLVAIAVVALSGLLFLNEAVPFAAAVLLLGLAGVALLARNAAGTTTDAPVTEVEAEPKAKKAKEAKEDKAPKPAKGAKEPKAKKVAKKSSRDKLEEAIEQAGPMTPAAFSPAPSTPAAPPAAGGLPTWNANTLDTWTPPAAEPAPEAAELPAASEPSWMSWDEGSDTGPVADEFDDDNPLAALDRLDEIDPIAEVERLDSLGADAPAADSGFSFSSAPKVINEEAVQTADDIMAASEATELHVASDENSELAKLLAKVQARLAAYE